MRVTTEDICVHFLYFDSTELDLFSKLHSEAISKLSFESNLNTVFLEINQQNLEIGRFFNFELWEHLNDVFNLNSNKLNAFMIILATNSNLINLL